METMPHTEYKFTDKSFLDLILAENKLESLTDKSLADDILDVIPIQFGTLVFNYERLNTAIGVNTPSHLSSTFQICLYVHVVNYMVNFISIITSMLYISAKWNFLLIRNIL